MHVHESTALQCDLLDSFVPQYAQFLTVLEEDCGTSLAHKTLNLRYQGRFTYGVKAHRVSWGCYKAESHHVGVHARSSWRQAFIASEPNELLEHLL